MVKTSTRMTAKDRREQVLGAAMAVFARDGYEGTSTEDVARAAEVSQPYLFRIFSTKKALFIELVERGFERVSLAFGEAAEGLSGEEALAAMGAAYGQLLVDRDLLLLQMHAYAASNDPEIGATTRRCFRDLWEHVGVLSGVSSEMLTNFFAHGMLLNVIAALDATDLGESWVASCLAAGARP
jgi:AcrR family transcriptional regulator